MKPCRREGDARLVDLAARASRRDLLRRAGRARVALVSLAFVTIQLLSLVAFDVKTWGVLIWNSTTLGHDWLDGVIWKLRRPDVAKHLV